MRWKKPHGPEKKGTKRSVAVESHRLPVGIVLDRANRRDIKLLEETLRSNVTAHPEEINVCLDAGMSVYKSLLKGWGIAHIRSRGEEWEEKEYNPQYVARRWVVEVCHSWMNRFRKLLARYEKKARNYQALVEFACTIIIWRNVIPVHLGLIP
jgi:transposase